MSISETGDVTEFRVLEGLAMGLTENTVEAAEVEASNSGREPGGGHLHRGHEPPATIGWSDKRALHWTEPMRNLDLVARPGHAFRLDEERLCDLSSATEEATHKEVGIEVESPDGERKFDGVQQFLDYGRSSERRIRELTVSSRNSAEGLSVSVNFDASWNTYYPLRVSVSGPDEEKVESTFGELLALVKRTRPWYSFLSRYVGTVNTIFLILYVTVFLGSLLSPETSEESTNSITIPVRPTLVVLGIGVVANMARSFVFPGGRFALWRGAAYRTAVRQLIASPPPILTLLATLLALVLTTIALFR